MFMSVRTENTDLHERELKGYFNFPIQILLLEK